MLLRCLGLLAGVVAQAVDGRMPADQETIRYTGFYGTDRSGKPFLSREVLGGGSGGRYYADGNDAIHIVPDSRNQPAEFTETRFPLLVEKLALRTDSGGAGKRRGGLGYEKHYRALVDCRTIVTADRVRLGCYGVNGGKAGLPFCVTIDIEGDAARSRRPGRRRAGAGGPDRARAHHRRRRLGRSARARTGTGAARRDRRQGVAAAARERLWRRAVTDAGGDPPSIDEAATEQLPRRTRAASGQDNRRRSIDRGEGYEKMLRGEFKPWIR